MGLCADQASYTDNRIFFDEIRIRYVSHRDEHPRRVLVLEPLFLFYLKYHECPQSDQDRERAESL
jgi:hypothetical protein